MVAWSLLLLSAGAADHVCPRPSSTFGPKYALCTGNVAGPHAAQGQTDHATALILVASTVRQHVPDVAHELAAIADAEVREVKPFWRPPLKSLLTRFMAMPCMQFAAAVSASLNTHFAIA